VRLVPRFPAPNQRHPERLPSPPEWRFSRLGADHLPGRLSGALMPRVRHRSEAVDVEHGQLIGRHLNRFAVVMSLDKLAAVGVRSPGRRDWWWLERFARMREGLTSRGRSHPGLLPLADVADRECRDGFSQPVIRGELVRVHDDRDVFQASPDEPPAIDIHSL